MTKKTTYKIQDFGAGTKRRNYSKTKNTLDMFDLTKIQKESFDEFLKKGIEATLRRIYPITSNNGKITINYIHRSLDIKKSKNEYDEVKIAKNKGTTYSFKIYATLQKVNETTGEVKDDVVHFGEIPLMTSGGSFIVNGTEKVIISQLLRAPGAYYGMNVKTSKTSDGELYNRLELIPYLGIWIDIYHRATGNTTDFVKVSIDKNKPISLSLFLRALGLQKEDILDLFGKDIDIIKETLRKDNKKDKEVLDYVHNIIRKGDRVTDKSRKNLFVNLLFDDRRYDLSKIGRFTLNRKLSLVSRITNTILGEDLITKSGEVLYKKGKKITAQVANDIQSNFDNGLLKLFKHQNINSSVYGELVELNKKLEKRISLPLVKVFRNEEDLKEGEKLINVFGTSPNADERQILITDLIASISYYFNLYQGLGESDDPDSLINKRVISIGELLRNQLQISLTKVERNAKERMSARDIDSITPKNITNNKIVFNQFKTFFNSSQLSQFMDQTNPLSEISNKRRITSLGPGGLNRDTANFEVRDVHPTHYGRICPIETPEGPNIGLILNFSSYAQVDEYGFIKTPYYPVKNGQVSLEPIFLTAIDEHDKTFAQSSIELDEDNKIIEKNITARKNQEYIIVKPNEIDYLDVSSNQVASISASGIPFLENDDANRALMGANMQRQAVPLLTSSAPLVATGIEEKISKYSSANIKAKSSGDVVFADSTTIKVKSESGKTNTYLLRNFERSNQGTVITQRPLVKVGDKVGENQVLNDGMSFDNGELALGKNVLVAFSTWRGYNYEDAIILSERLVKNDVYTSVHIEEQTIQFRTSKMGDDKLTTELPNVSNFARRFLDERGIVRIGSEVQAGDVLVGRASPKGEENFTPEEKLIASIFSQRTNNYKDTSLKVKHGHGGTVIDVEVLSRETNDKLQDGLSMTVRVFVAQKRKIKVGDKMAGRHGNKGVISTILPIEDMPHLEDGTPIDILLNPQGVPSRMNIGQVLELHLGLAAKELNVKFVSPVFDGIKFDEIQKLFKEANLPEDGKFKLFDPISNDWFDQKITVGVMYMLKLSHMVDDKMHARSIGPYSLITQQPLGGKSQNGGQRFGEMETWALESYGAANTLQEILTYKSDNISGRNQLFSSLVHGAPTPLPGTPESFNVLAYELRGLGMKLGVKMKDDKQAIEEEFDGN